jgi:hypothetical protein
LRSRFFAYYVRVVVPRQIYNVDKRIQEDNLQHLALFSEYGRMALSSKGSVAEQVPACCVHVTICPAVYCNC